MVKVSPPEEMLLPSRIPSSTLPPEPEPFKFGRRPPSHSPALLEKRYSVRAVLLF